MAGFYARVRRLRRSLGLRVGLTEVDCLSSDLDAARASLGEPGELARLFFSTDGRVVNKWVHYLPIYERYFASYREKPAKILEIGVNQGGSLDLWRRYFGPDATIFGIDINPRCAERVTAPNQVRIGSQADPDFLRRVVGEMGNPDIVLDDGSHRAQHQRTSFETLFPLLAEGGLYVIEDTHTAYWRRFGGGYRRRGTAIELAKRVVDDMHAWYHDHATTTDAHHSIGAVAFFDSLIVFEKRRHGQPINIQVGRG